MKIVILDFNEKAKKLLLEGHYSSINTITFSPDGKTLASGSNDRKTIIWNLETGKEIIEYKCDD